ncbi:MAG: low molecular weight phosphatase family protein [Actinobacteria bacterium]|nr:low molecular weight phosphatase family protein [Actinomycetota bacterium]
MKILFVCTGNQCRSPFAEAYLNHLELPGIEATSAGTLDLPGRPVPPEMRRAAEAYGVDLSPHRSRPAHSLDPSDFDLLIGFEHSHAAYLVVEKNAPMERTFLFGELRLLIREEGFSLDPDALGLSRGSSGVFDPKLQVSDPIGGPPAAYRAAAATIATGLDEILGGVH